jgi:hypothetical protein
MQMDSRASSREMVAPPGREPLIATVRQQKAQSQSRVGVSRIVMASGYPSCDVVSLLAASCLAHSFSSRIQLWLLK